MLYVLIIFLGGFMLGAQGPTNASLARVVGSSLQAAVASFGGGVILLALAVIFFGSGDLLGVTSVPPWMLLGGLYGALIVVTNVLAVPLVGATLTMMLIMLGQLVTGLAVDTFGLVGVTPVPLVPLRIAGVVCVAIGIAFTYAGSLRMIRATNPATSSQHTTTNWNPRTIAIIVLTLIAGCTSGIQAPTNAALGAVIGTIEASLVNFIVGFATVLVATLVSLRGRLRNFIGAKPWQFMGGVYGAVNVVTIVAATPALGVSLTMATLMLGQIVSGLIIDANCWFQMRKTKADPLRVVGAIAVALGIILFRLV